jgi:pimeloyl-ACP methyl ester carboxylesterase
MTHRPLPPLDGRLALWPGEQVDRLYVRRGPRDGGEPAVMVHGLGGSSANWTDLVGVLAGAVEAEVLDLPGFGRSAPPRDGRYTVGAHSRAVVRHLEHSGRGRSTCSATRSAGRSARGWRRTARTSSAP